MDRSVAVVDIKPEPIAWPTFDLGFNKPDTKEVEHIDIPMDTAPFAGMTPVEIARELIDRFHDNFDVKISKVYFNNAKAFRHTLTFAGNVHKLYLGLKTLAYAFNEGSWDHVTVMHKMGVSVYQYKGALGVAWIVAHELAHALQMDGAKPMKRKRKSYDVHNDQFVRCFKQVLEIVPEIR
jgi:hypothetical protein